MVLIPFKWQTAINTFLEGRTISQSRSRRRCNILSLGVCKEGWVPWSQLWQFIRYGTLLISFAVLRRGDPCLRLLPPCTANIRLDCRYIPIMCWYPSEKSDGNIHLILSGCDSSVYILNFVRLLQCCRPPDVIWSSAGHGAWSEDNKNKIRGY